MIVIHSDDDDEDDETLARVLPLYLGSEIDSFRESLDI